MNLLGDLFTLFAKLSLLAVGGVNSTVPAIIRMVVDQRHWITTRQFSQLFAIAQAAPGPNMLIVALIGQHVAGVAGALAATVGTVLPSGILVLYVSNIWHRFQHARWRRILQAAIIPITGGLILSAAYVLVRAADTGWVLALVTVTSTLLCLTTRLHPLWLLAGGLLAGLIFT